VTLVVPTRNRPQFLERALRYYQELKFQYPIIVADSSDGDHPSHIKHIISALGTSLSIEHRRYQTGTDLAGLVNKLFDALQDVTTPYAAIGADDDFFVPSTLSRAAQFLQEHPDYAIAHGEAVVFALKTPTVYGQIQSAGPYNQCTVNHSTGAQRLIDHFTHISATMYSVHRTEQLRENFHKTVASASGKEIFIEMLPLGLSLVQGKAKKLDSLYMVRQVHSAKEYNALPDALDWIASPDWASVYQRFRDCLAGELAQQDRISIDEAREVVKQAFWSYLGQALTKNWQGRYAQNSPELRSHLRKLARRMRVLRWAWHTSSSLLPGQDNKKSQQALLRPTSRYHRDFMPIYRAITSTGGNLKGAGDSPGQPPGAPPGTRP
jgi:glycosyltransferase domain-containing protein